MLQTFNILLSEMLPTSLQFWVHVVFLQIYAQNITWVKSIPTSEESSMDTANTFSPSVIDNYSIFDRAII